MRRIVAFGPALVVLLAALGALWGIPRVVQRANAVRVAASVAASREILDTAPILEQINAATRAIAGAVEPSVVHIDVKTELGGSTGSGWVYDDLGHIITNAHVVRGAREVRVQFQDGLVVPASVQGSDALTDVAVVKVDPQPSLIAARRGVETAVQQGDRVFAFGSPFGYKFSMSEGIISGLGRVAGPAVELGGFSNLIQTDAAVNPGNSGGPLVDVKGRVIGMNVAIATARAERGEGRSEGGQNSGISFAIPVSTVEYVVEQLIQNGKVLRGYLGLSFGSPPGTPLPAGLGAAEPTPIHDEAGKYRGSGLAVSRVVQAGPAAMAGLKPGDVVTAINGQPITSFAALRGIVGSIRPGERVSVKFWRASKFMESTVALGEMPAAALIVDEYIFILQRAGAILRNTPEGAVVVQVMGGSPFDIAGLEPGTLVLGINGTATPTVMDVAVQLLERGWLTGDEVEFTVITRGALPGARPTKIRARQDDAWAEGRSR